MKTLLWYPEERYPDLEDRRKAWVEATLDYEYHQAQLEMCQQARKKPEFADGIRRALEKWENGWGATRERELAQANMHTFDGLRERAS